MADLKISAMTAASALVGTEVVPGVQSAANVKITAMQIGTYVAANLGVAAGTSLSLGGNISAPAWTTAGIRYANVAATMTDTTSSGTVAAAYTDVFAGNTIAASNATTFTNYYGAYFKNPVAGTNVTFTSSAALAADSLSIIGSLYVGPSVVVGNQALATTATDGFLYIPTCAGTPTGTPTTQTGRIAMVYDTTNHQFWFYDGGWKQPKTPAGAALVTWQ